MAHRQQRAGRPKPDRSRARATSRKAPRATRKPAKKARSGKRKPKPKPEAPPTEFDAWLASLTPRERRVDEVIQLMNAGAWFGATSHRALAKKWGVHPGTVEHVATEANRVIRLQFRYDRDPDARRDALARTVRNFEAIHHLAMVSGSVSGLRVALEAQEAFGRYVGIEPPKNVRVKTGDDEFEKLTDEQLDAVSRDGSAAIRRIKNEQDAAVDEGASQAKSPAGGGNA